MNLVSPIKYQLGAGEVHSAHAASTGQVSPHHRCLCRWTFLLARMGTRLVVPLQQCIFG